MSEPVEAVPCATIINVIGSLTVRCGHVEARHLPDGGAHPCLDCVACRGFTSGEPVEAVEPRTEAARKLMRKMGLGRSWLPLFLAIEVEAALSVDRTEAVEMLAEALERTGVGFPGITSKHLAAMILGNSDALAAALSRPAAEGPLTEERLTVVLPGAMESVKQWQPHGNRAENVPFWPYADLARAILAALGVTAPVTAPPDHEQTPDEAWDELRATARANRGMHREAEAPVTAPPARCPNDCDVCRDIEERYG